MTPPSVARENPGIPVPPPVFFVAGFGLALFLHRQWPLELSPLLPRAPLVVGGWTFIATYPVLFLWAALSFRRAQTSMIPNQPATSLVCVGPYRFSRNPMYLSVIALFFGLGLLKGSLWPLLVLIPLVVALRLIVIRREEDHLTHTFGAAYEAYRQQVRRWL